MENTYVLCALVSFVFGFLIVMLPAIHKNENKRSGFNTPQAIIKSDVDDVRGNGQYKSADLYNERRERF